jgi:hypothetical protein
VLTKGEGGQCAANLAATAARNGRQIDTAELLSKLQGLIVKPLKDQFGKATDPSIRGQNVVGQDYNVFDGSASEIRAIQEQRGKDVGATSLDGVFLFNEFFSKPGDPNVNPDAKIGLDQTRAIALLHVSTQWASMTMISARTPVGGCKISSSSPV